jgi:hypothetical protein
VGWLEFWMIMLRALWPAFIIGTVCGILLARVFFGVW